MAIDGIGKINIGRDKIDKVYIGDELVFESEHIIFQPGVISELSPGEAYNTRGYGRRDTNSGFLWCQPHGGYTFMGVYFAVDCDLFSNLHIEITLDTWNGAWYTSWDNTGTNKITLNPGTWCGTTWGTNSTTAIFVNGNLSGNRLVWDLNLDNYSGVQTFSINLITGWESGNAAFYINLIRAE